MEGNGHKSTGGLPKLKLPEAEREKHGSTQLKTGSIGAYSSSARLGVEITPLLLARSRSASHPLETASPARSISMRLLSTKHRAKTSASSDRNCDTQSASRDAKEIPCNILASSKSKVSTEHRTTDSPLTSKKQFPHLASTGSLNKFNSIAPTPPSPRTSESCSPTKGNDSQESPRRVNLQKNLMRKLVRADSGSQFLQVGSNSDLGNSSGNKASTSSLGRQDSASSNVSRSSAKGVSSIGRENSNAVKKTRDPSAAPAPLSSDASLKPKYLPPLQPKPPAKPSAECETQRAPDRVSPNSSDSRIQPQEESSGLITAGKIGAAVGSIAGLFRDITHRRASDAHLNNQSGPKMYNSIRGTLKYVEKSVTESFQSIKNQTHSVFSQMKSTHSVTGSSHTSSRVIREEIEGPISEHPEFPVSLAKTQKEYTVKTGLAAGSFEGTLAEHEQKLTEFIGQFDENARILAECRAISSLKKAAPQSTRELEKLFLKDYSFLDDRFSSMLTNHINNLSRDLNQYQRAAVHKVEWLQLNQMIRNFLLLHQSLYPSNTIFDANIAYAVTGPADADITALGDDIKKAMINWPHAQFLRLKMNLRHLERLCRCLDDFSDTLFRPMSILFAPLLLKNGPPQLSFQIKGIEPSATPLPQTKITSPPILMPQESIALPKPSPPACVSPNILSSAKEAEEDEDAEEDALLELEFDRWNRAKVQGRRMTKFADVIAKMMSHDHVDFHNHNPTLTEQRILCASCGTVIAPNPANMCINCIRSDVDITEGIPKQATIHYCKGCDRYLQPPNVWVVAELESKELLTLCLKKLRGLSKVRLVDAGFIWTEPHSRRVKVKLTIQKEVFANTILQQVFVVEYMVSTQQCEECTRVAAQLTWKAVVQVRQKVSHKRTFLWLEQVILKHNAHQNTTNIKEAKDGIDFYYTSRSHAIRMVEFLQSVVPAKLKTSEQLISQDIHSGTANYKFSYSLEIVPICKDDLFVLPTKVAKSLSDISPLVLCSRVSNSLSVLDPNTLKISDMRNTVYWDNPCIALSGITDLVEFYVIDIQHERVHNGRFGLATAEISRSKDLSQTFLVRTHLGNILRPGDHVLGYDLRNANFNDENWDKFISKKNAVPDIVLVRKSYPNARKKLKGRNWKLKTITVEEEVEAMGKSKAEKAKADQDYELFLRDIEEDPELRGMMNLYKQPTKQSAHDASGDAMQYGDDSEEEPEEDFPEINEDELLEELMDGMAIGDEGDVGSEKADADVEEEEME
ncbi:hypothetical protein CcCBS67573_g01576 [Chytriomyces confervae]|uniref:60S ribosomal export protein NMD3 n=1 Tax=Chytriomyces confervae TaxID=246404 RepID=A0A507FLM8_9FUNG|nr:hypothetical protein CcCBS67573_g01576 [Chytriomyces confervae]